MAEGGKGLWVGTPESASAKMAVGGRRRRGGGGVLENTRVGSRAPAEMARARVDEGRDGDEVPAGQESEEDGPGPP